MDTTASSCSELGWLASRLLQELDAADLLPDDLSEGDTAALVDRVAQGPSWCMGDNAATEANRHIHLVKGGHTEDTEGACLASISRTLSTLSM